MVGHKYLQLFLSSSFKNEKKSKSKEQKTRLKFQLKTVG